MVVSVLEEPRDPNLVRQAPLATLLEQLLSHNAFHAFLVVIVKEAVTLFPQAFVKLVSIVLKDLSVREKKSLLPAILLRTVQQLL